MAEGDQRRMHAVLERRSVLDQMQSPPGALPLGPQLRGRKPNRRHQIAKRQLGEDPSIDLVGLARQRRQPLDPLRIGDQHLPPVPDQLVVHEPCAVHRLNDPAHRLVVYSDPPRQPVQTVPVRRRPEMLDQLPLTGYQAHVDPLAAQIQTHVQHQRFTLPSKDEQDQPGSPRNVSRGRSFVFR